MPLLLLRNINLLAGLANDTCLVLLKVLRYITVTVVSCLIHRVVFLFHLSDLMYHLKVLLSLLFVSNFRYVSPSFAMTINKSTGGCGATFSEIGIFLCFHSC